MRRLKAPGLPLILALFASAGYAGAANATVLIKTFQFAICVTGAKHPDGCKNAGADAHVVVSDDAMDQLDGKIGQGATITAVAPKGAAPAEGQGRRRRRQGEDAQ